MFTGAGRIAWAIGILLLILVLAMPMSLATSEGDARLDERAREILAGMTTEQKIGQVLLMHFRSWGKDAQDNPVALEECNDAIRGIIRDYHLGNIILFGENVKSTKKAVELVDALQSAAEMPLLIGIDQEGGIVTRLGQGTCLPGNMALGATGDAENALKAGAVVGAELSAIGVNTNFAPDCDVNDNPQNPVIHLRSFSSDPAVVSAMAAAYRKGLAQSGVIASAKHFPGHGNTSVDTHVGLAVVEKPRAAWEAVEAVPFRAMIKDGVDVVMSAHIQYPGLDDTKYTSKLTGESLYLPATLSHKILTKLLREDMGFDGVVVTDAMDMDAIVNNFGETEASVMALSAGADLLCNPTAITGTEDVAKLDRLYGDIKAALTDGRLSAARLDEAAGKVIRLKLKSGIWDGEPDARTLEEKVEGALNVVGSPAHRATERALADAAITLYAQSPHRPFTPAQGDSVLFLVPYENKGSSARYAMNRLMAEGKLPAVTVDTAVYEEQASVSDAVRAQIGAADWIVVVTQMSAGALNAPESWQIKTPALLLQAAAGAGKAGRCAVISIGLPNDAANFPGTPVYIAYGYQGMAAQDAETLAITQKYGPNLPAAVDCLMGAFDPAGTLPVEIK